MSTKDESFFYAINNIHAIIRKYKKAKRGGYNSMRLNHLCLNRKMISLLCALLVALVVCSFEAVYGSIPVVEHHSTNMSEEKVILKVVHAAFKIISNHLKTIPECKDAATGIQNRTHNYFYGKINLLLMTVAIEIIIYTVYQYMAFVSKDNHTLIVSYIQNSDGKK